MEGLHGGYLFDLSLSDDSTFSVSLIRSERTSASGAPSNVLHRDLASYTVFNKIHPAKKAQRCKILL